MALARSRLQSERKAWRKDHPFGFVAKPRTLHDGSQDLFTWDVVVPARDGSVWAPARVPAVVKFSEDYPSTPPVVKFNKIAGRPIFHPNVFPDGRVCLSITNPNDGSRHHYGVGGTWQPSLSLKHVLLALQQFLDEVTSYAAGRELEYKLFTQDRPAYNRKVKEQVNALLPEAPVVL